MGRFTPNEAALQVLLASEQGPVGHGLVEMAQAIVDMAEDNIDIIMWRVPSDVSRAVDYEYFEDTASVAIGIRSEGTISEYLAEKEDREHVWLTPALEEELRDFDLDDFDPIG
jgi:hypothetical protein